MALTDLRRTLWLLRTLPPAAKWWAVRRLLESPASRQHRLEAALRDTAGRLVFVCHGNIMRSAFAAEVARGVSPANADRIVSGGTHARQGREAEVTAASVARQLGMSLDHHRASSLASLSLTARDVVVCMDRANEANVLTHVEAPSRVFLVGDIAAGETAADPSLARDSREVMDPYGKGEGVTRSAFESLRVIGEMWSRRYFADRGAPL